MSGVTTETVVTCPACGASERAVMPVNACVHFHRCGACDALLSPLEGDCCVFCSYGDAPCPPKQLEGTAAR